MVYRIENYSTLVSHGIPVNRIPHQPNVIFRIVSKWFQCSIRKQTAATTWCLRWRGLLEYCVIGRHEPHYSVIFAQHRSILTNGSYLSLPVASWTERALLYIWRNRCISRWWIVCGLLCLLVVTYILPLNDPKWLCV